jgi:acyl carrier protein
MMTPQSFPDEAAIRTWCRDLLSRMLEIPVEEIGFDTKFSRLGLDSASAIYLIAELEEWLGVELAPELAGDYPTIFELSRHLAARFRANDLQT